MDFVRLAGREVRRNATKTLVAIMAVALAAAAPVLARVIPEGYPTQYCLPERQFIGGDLVIWRAVTPIDTRERSPLEWRPWGGSDWQSHALYFIPSLGERGYLAEALSPGWGPMEGVAEALEGVAGIYDVTPYLAAPCSIETPDGPVQAILRGWAPDLSPLSMSHMVDIGRPLFGEDFGSLSALVPMAGGLPDGAVAVGRDLLITVAGGSYTLKPVGGYRVVVGEVGDVTRHSEGQNALIPVYWERPEIVVTTETFRQIVKDAPVYQYSVRADRMSTLDSKAAEIRRALGPGFAVYSVPELVALKNSDAVIPIRTADFTRILLSLSFGLSGVIVAGSIYILLSQQRRKIGLLRVIGAKRRDVMVYVLSMVAYVTLAGDGAGFLGGKLLSLLPVAASDMTWGEWLRLTLSDLSIVFGLSLPIAAALGLAVGAWASRIPCSEVLRRE